MTFRILLNRRLIAALAALVTAAVVLSAISSADASGGHAGSRNGRDGGFNRHHEGSETYTIGLFGDMPYGALGRSQYPNLLANINQSHVSFSIFDGDLQAGGDGPVG